VTGCDGRIRIPRADLEAVGLVPTEGGTLRGVGEVGSLEPAALLDRVVEQAEEIGRLKALPERVGDRNILAVTVTDDSPTGILIATEGRAVRDRSTGAAGIASTRSVSGGLSDDTRPVP